MAIGRINATLTGVQPGGLAKIVPTSVAVGSGSGSVDSNGKITFSGSSSISINDVFSSSYLNYKIFLDLTTKQTISLRMRVNGSDNSSNNYHMGRAYSTGSNTGGWVFSYGGNLWGLADGNGSSFIDLNLTSPFATNNTGINHTSFIDQGAANNSYANTYQGVMSVTTSYTSFSFIFGGNATGTVNVYGYN